MTAEKRDNKPEFLGFLKSRLWFGLLLAAFAAAMIWPHAGKEQPAAAANGPLAGRVICVDAGHGGYDGGARAPGGVWEKEINLSVALKVQEALEAAGARVVMTRQTDRDLADTPNGAATKKRRDMKARLQIAREGGAQMLLSIHMNEYRHPSSSGPQVFYEKGSDASRLLAGCLQESLIHALQPEKERSAQAGDYYILTGDMPACLVECGFLSNPREEKLLLDEAYQQRIARGILAGVEAYYTLQSRAGVVE